MSVPVDLRELFASWPYDPNNNARIIRASDGRDVLQVRQPVGIEQYELAGRPDGCRPHNHETALDYQLDRLAKARAEGKADTFRLSHGECVELFDEGVLYYYRYLNLFQLKEWERVIHDTARNGKLFDFVNRHAKREEDRQHLEQWRPYLIRMTAVARAMMEIDRDAYEVALGFVRQAIDAIEALPEMDNPTFAFERDRSLSALRELADHIEETRPVSEVERVERALEQAVEAQEFERAAKLRDRLRNLRK